MKYQTWSKKQLLAATWWARKDLRDRDGIICDGAIRSGKTLAMVDGFVLWAMTCFQGEKFAICGKTVEAVRRNIVMDLPAWLGGVVQIREKRSHSALEIRYQGRKNTFFLFGGRDESAYMQVQGVTLAGALMDEVALMPRSFVEQVCARCSVAGSRLWFNCNPAGPEHWFYKEWICQARERNMLHLHFTMEDNLSLDPAIRRRYERMYTGAFYRRYILGQWCMAEGLVYEFDPERHVVKEVPDQGRWYISCDYGTQNPFSAGLWCVDKGKAVRAAEFYYSGRDRQRMMTDEEYYQALEELAGDRRIECVVVDPSAASFIACIRRHGRFPVRKARNEVLTGIRMVAAMLQSGKIRIGAGCADAIREFGLYRWDDRGEEDRVMKEHDHAMDDIRYFCATVMGRRVMEE